MIDLILYNGRIYTQSNPSFVSAMAITHGRIVAIGTDNDIRPLARAHTRQYNLNGAFVMSGLTDAHVHWEWTARALSAVDLFEVPSLAEALQRVQAVAQKTPSGQWITGRGWAQGLWESLAFPTAQDLDTVTGDRPASFNAKSGHAAWVNSAALRLCGVTASTPDPEGGQIMRDAQGNPTGILLETAMRLVNDHIPNPTPDQLADQMTHLQGLALARGLTGIHDFDNPSALTALQIQRERGQLALRVVKQINQAWLDHAVESGIRFGYGDEWIRFGCLKLFADGALGPKTALMVEPYIGEPDNVGIEVLTKAEMTALASKASLHGLPTTIHAIGDLAVRNVLDVFQTVRQEEQARGETTTQRRHRIEHVQIIHPDDKYRLRDMDIIASMQPMHATSDWTVADRYWGDRCAWAYNARWQIDQGVRYAFGSDTPIEPFDPFLGLHAAVTRQRDGQPAGGWYPELRLTLAEAIAGFTTGAAYCGGMENTLGKLDVGYWADCIVLDRDLFAIEPDAIPSTQVTATMVGGAWRHGGVD